MNAKTHSEGLTPSSPVPALADWAGALVNRLREGNQIDPGDLAVLQRQVSELAHREPGPSPKEAPQIQIVRHTHQLPALAGQLAGAAAVAVDLETSALDPVQGEIVGIGLAVPDRAWYLPTGHRFPGGQLLLPDQLLPAQVAQHLRLGALPLVAHNAKFELKWLRRHAHVVPVFVWDTMVAAKLLRSDLPADLKEAARRVLDVPDWGLTRDEMRNIALLPIDRAARYCGRDALYTLRLMEAQKKCLV